MALRNIADVQHRKSKWNKVSPLRINGRKACLPKEYFLQILINVQWVQDVHQEMQYMFPNWTSRRRSNSNMVPRRNSEDQKRICDMIFTDLCKHLAYFQF